MGPMYALFETEFGVRMVRADEKIRAVHPDAEQARLLGVAPTTPLLSVERQVVGWFEVAPEQRYAFHPSRCPVFLLQDAQGNYFYGAGGAVPVWLLWLCAIAGWEAAWCSCRARPQSHTVRVGIPCTAFPLQTSSWPILSTCRLPSGRARLQGRQVPPPVSVEP